MSTVVKETKDYKILKKRNGRYGIRKNDGKWLNKEEKVKILVSEGLIKVSLKKEAPKEEAQTSEAAEPAE